MYTILIIEDDLYEAANIKKTVLELGYRASVLIQDYSTTRPLLETSAIDLVLAGINTREACTGIATYMHYRKRSLVPVIFLATYEASVVLRQIRLSQPTMFLTKPFTNACLQAAIGVAIAPRSLPQPAPQAQVSPPPLAPINSAAFHKSIFVRKGGGYAKLFLSDIFYIEALQNYIKIHTATTNFIVDSTLKDFEQKLPGHFLKTHRSYIVNIDNIHSYHETYVSFAGHQVPVSRSCQEELKTRINVLR